MYNSFNNVNNPMARSVMNVVNTRKNTHSNQTERSQKGFKIDEFEKPQNKQAPVLSKAAQSLLEDLQKQFNNVYFIVADFSSDTEAQRYLSQGKGAINCVITPDLLERMAADPQIRAKYEALLDEAIGKLGNMKEEMGEKSEMVRSFGISFDSTGSISYYAMLKDGLPKNINGGSRVVKAGSIEELMKRLDEIDEERRAEKAHEKRKEKLNIDVEA
jgi:hypothetical protein